MEYQKLGDSELTVSKICIGCLSFGDPKIGNHTWTLDEEASMRILKYCFDQGINFFDTAVQYSGGTSEMYVGKAIRTYANRDDIVLATKVSPRLQKEIDAGISGQESVRQSVDRSLEHLGLDHIDLLVMHMWDYNTPIEDMMEGMNDAVKAGKVRYIGMSNCFAWQLAKANHIAEREGWAKFVSLQGHYNLIAREEEREMLPYCADANIGLTPYSALAGGRLAMKPGAMNDRIAVDKLAHDKYDATAEQDNVIIARIAEIAEKYGVSMAEVAISWLAARTTSPIVGVRTEDKVDSAIRALELKLSPEDAAYLEEPYVPHELVGPMAQSWRDLMLSGKDDKH